MLVTGNLFIYFYFGSSQQIAHNNDKTGRVKTTAAQQGELSLLRYSSPEMNHRHTSESESTTTKEQNLT